MPRPLASILTLLFVLLVLAGLVTLVSQQVATGFPDLQKQSGQGLTDVRTWLANGPFHVTGDADRHLDRSGAGQSQRQQQPPAHRRARCRLDGGGRRQRPLHRPVQHLLLPVHGRPDLGLRRQPVPARRAATGRGGCVHAWATLTAYVRATVIVAAVDAIGIGLGAAILGVPLAVPIAVLVFLGAFVPIVGALVTGIVAVLVALVSKGFVVAVIMLAVVIAVQQLEAHVLQPFLLGRAVEVHPLAVILAIGAGVLIAGIVGALFAVPLVAVGHVVSVYLRDGDGGPGQNAPPGDRAPETPREDADDAAQQAGPLADAPVPDPASARLQD